MRVGDIERLAHEKLPAFPEVLGAYLFGSVLAGGLSRDIDVGLVVGDLSERDRITLEVRVAEALGELEGRPFDVTVLSQDPPFLAHTVLRTGRLIYGRDREAIGDFIERVSRAYAELYPRYRKALDEVLEGVRP